MKTEKNILIAFLLNLSFSIFEVIGGLFTGSVAILSDAVHDLGDATSIGLSFFLEKTTVGGLCDQQMVLRLLGRIRKRICVLL